MKKQKLILLLSMMVLLSVTMWAIPTLKKVKSEQMRARTELAKELKKESVRKYQGKTRLDKAKKSTNILQAKANEADDQVIFEDFTKFTAGTEATPDATDMANEEGYVDAAYTMVDGWTGGGIHQAGGVCALLMMDNGSGGQETGFINTPEMDLSNNNGTFTVNFRAKSSSPEGDTFGVIYVDAPTENYDGEEIQITNEWADYTITVDGAGTGAMFLQMASYGSPCFIDNISIDQKITGIKAPEALYPTDITATGFTANWGEVSAATSYLLNVYSYKVTEGATPEVTVTENFDAINVSGKNIDATNPNFPVGWTIDVATNGKSREVYTSQGNFASGPLSIAFDASEDNIVSPLSSVPLTQLFFWIKDNSGDGASYVLVSSNNGSAWTEMTKVYAPATGEVVDLSDKIPAGTLQFKLTYVKSAGNVAIDDVSYTTGGDIKTKTYLLNDEIVSGTSKAVTGTIEGTTYYYTVKAKNDEYTSVESAEMKVEEQLSELATPVLLPATNITDKSFTANWQQVDRAVGYAVYARLTHTASVDENYAVVNEGFDGMTTDANISGFDDYLDEFTTYPDWEVIIGITANGMIGISNDYAEMGLNGMLFSPSLKLNNNDGNYNVTVKVQGKTGDVVTIVNASLSDQTLEEISTFTLTDDQLKEYTVSFVEGVSDSYIAIMTSGETLMIDDVKINQNLKAGEFAIVNCGYQDVEKTSCDFMNLENKPENSFSYVVTAYAFDADDEIISSQVSEPMDVVLYPKGLSLSERDSVKIYVIKDLLHVTLEKEGVIEIYNAAGQLVATQNGVVGDNTFTLPVGTIYLVKTTNGTVKARM